MDKYYNIGSHFLHVLQTLVGAGKLVEPQGMTL